MLLLKPEALGGKVEAHGDFEEIVSVETKNNKVGFIE